MSPIPGPPMTRLISDVEPPLSLEYCQYAEYGIREDSGWGKGPDWKDVGQLGG